VLHEFSLPTRMPGIRVETGYAQGNSVGSHYDPMVAKLVAHGADRNEAIARLRAALDGTRIQGIKTNIPMVSQVLSSPAFRRGSMTVDGLSAALQERQAAPSTMAGKEQETV
jgi:acetyl-CoA carboxylase biotin carboxylase subunit